MKLCISMGSVHKLVNHRNRDNAISYIRKLDLDFYGIEILVDKDDFEFFELSESNINWLKQLNYLSLHLNINLPNCGFIKKYDYLVNKYIWHNDKKITLLDLGLKKYKEIKNKFLLENLDVYNTAFFYNLDPSINDVCCDISHGLSYGLDYLENFISINKEYIQQFHISNFKNGECHIPFYNDKNDKLKKIKKIIKENNLLGKPFVMEYNFSNLQELLKEYYYIENVFEGYV